MSTLPNYHNLKKLRITYIKVNKIQSQNQITQLMEQNIITTKQEFTIPVFPGWQVLRITELLPDQVDTETAKNVN